MEPFVEYLAGIQNPQHRARMAEVLCWVGQTFHELLEYSGSPEPSVR